MMGCTSKPVAHREDGCAGYLVHPFAKSVVSYERMCQVASTALALYPTAPVSSLAEAARSPDAGLCRGLPAPLPRRRRADGGLAASRLAHNRQGTARNVCAHGTACLRPATP